MTHRLCPGTARVPHHRHVCERDELECFFFRLSSFLFFFALTLVGCGFKRLISHVSTPGRTVVTIILGFPSSVAVRLILFVPLAFFQPPSTVFGKKLLEFSTFRGSVTRTGCCRARHAGSFQRR